MNRIQSKNCRTYEINKTSLSCFCYNIYIYIYIYIYPDHKYDGLVLGYLS